MNTEEYIDAIIEEYKDGRISSYQMLNYLNKLKEMVAVARDLLIY